MVTFTEEILHEKLNFLCSVLKDGSVKPSFPLKTDFLEISSQYDQPFSEHPFLNFFVTFVRLEKLFCVVLPLARSFTSEKTKRFNLSPSITSGIFTGMEFLMYGKISLRTFSGRILENFWRKIAIR